MVLQKDLIAGMCRSKINIGPVVVILPVHFADSVKDTPGVEQPGDLLHGKLIVFIIDFDYSQGFHRLQQ